MTTISLTEFRGNLATFLDRAEENIEPIVISRPRGKRSVVLSLQNYESLLETAYLLQSPANRKNLEASIEQLKKGETIPFEVFA